VWAELSGQPLPARIPETWQSRWADAAERNGFTPEPNLVLDATDAWPVTPRRGEIEKTNRARAESLRALILPALVRHAYPAYRLEAAPVALPDVVRSASGDPPASRVTMLQTSRGRILLRDVCPQSLIERLHPDPGLAAFTRRPEREHAIAMRVASSGHGTVAVAHTDGGTIVAQIVLTPSEDWWRDLPGVYEISIETSRDWRRLGIARAMLEFCVQPAWIEHVVLLAMGLDWHWDLQGAGLDADAYRAMLQHLFGPCGFRTMRTAEPNVGMHASNLLLVRTGAHVDADRVAALNEAMYVSPWLRERRAT
jgi:GNAT superfamily N-acetyltransferase